MNFSETLVDKFEEVHRFSQEKKKTTEDFLNLLKERALYEEMYSKGLNKIA